MDMLLAASVPLSKIINSTFGSGELKGFDESAVEKIYEEIKNQPRLLIESDKIIAVYPDEEWSDPVGEGKAIITNKSFRFSHSGRVRLILVLHLLSESIVNIYLCDSSGNAIQTWSTGISPRRGNWEVEVTVDVQKDTDYKILLQKVFGEEFSLNLAEPNLRICADVSTVV